MLYKRLIVKRGNTPIVTTDLAYAEVNINVREKADIEIWDERGKLVISFSIYPGRCLKVNQKDVRIQNTPDES